MIFAPKDFQSLASFMAGMLEAYLQSCSDIEPGPINKQAVKDILEAYEKMVKDG